MTEQSNDDLNRARSRYSSYNAREKQEFSLGYIRTVNYGLTMDRLRRVALIERFDR